MKAPLQFTGFVAALFLFILTGCTKDTSNPAPGDPRDNFTGAWRVTENETRMTYEVDVVLDETSSTAVKIINFANAGATTTPAVAEVSGNSITLVANQVIGDGWIINGGGTLTEAGTISWSYTLNDGATLHYLTATYSRLQW